MGAWTWFFIVLAAICFWLIRRAARLCAIYCAINDQEGTSDPALARETQPVVRFIARFATAHQREFAYLVAAKPQGRWVPPDYRLRETAAMLSKPVGRH